MIYTAVINRSLERRGALSSQPTPVRLKMYLANPEIDADDSRSGLSELRLCALLLFLFLLRSLTEDCCSDENISGDADGEGSVQGPAAGVTGASHPLFISSKRRNICRIDRIERQARTLGVLNGFDLIFKRGLAPLERKKNSISFQTLS